MVVFVSTTNEDSIKNQSMDIRRLRNSGEREIDIERERANKRENESERMRKRERERANKRENDNEKMREIES